MIRRTLFAVALVLSCTTFAAAQGQGDPPDPQGNADTQTTDVQELQRQVTALQQRVDDMEAELAKLPTIVEQLNGISTQLQGLDMVALQAMGEQMAELNTALSQIVTQSGDGYNIDILGKMNSSATFREEMRRATQGKIMFKNFTGLPQLVYINGTAWNVQPGESYIDAAVGNVSAQMAYFDLAPKSYNHWQFENGEYRLVIDIR